MNHIRKRRSFAILLIVLLLAQNVAFAQDARLTDIIVTNTRDDLLLYLNVEGAFREKMKETACEGERS